MSNKPFISFVVPCFNVEDYVGHTISSILNQSQTAVNGFDSPFEIILVNDGSTDGTLDLLRSYEAKYPCISIVTKENGGLSSARNAGIPLARGKYISCLDSDDWIASSFIEELVKNDARQSFDMALTNALVYDQVKQDYYPFYDDWLFNELCPRDSVRMLAPRTTLNAFLLEPNTSRRIFRTDFVRLIGMKYPEGVLYEDFPVHFSTFMLAGSVLLINKPLYYYRVGRSGKLTERNDDRRYDILKVFAMAARDLNEYGAGPEVGIVFLRAASRAIGWCLGSVPSRMARSFDIATREFFGTVPKPWLASFFSSKSVGNAEKFRIFSMTKGFYSRYLSRSREKRYAINVALNHLVSKDLPKFFAGLVKAISVK
ncbi:glycosyltransferase family 2 protein [Paraburkholderia silviterrae]|uniref:Glycosyltransferase n=1 Tax=Paraburkholderia silviterrae TaxID=2528715 RepID=A0A4R5LYG4_9BURK|nr:glycosyltransferase [Paraburkholderia silviterrae]TDG17394.1 glycosyltransferase [Paraburkholderia silviterrae]